MNKNLQSEKTLTNTGGKNTRTKTTVSDLMTSQNVGLHSEKHLKSMYAYKKFYLEKEHKNTDCRPESWVRLQQMRFYSKTRHNNLPLINRIIMRLKWTQRLKKDTKKSTHACASGKAGLFLLFKTPLHLFCIQNADMSGCVVPSNNKAMPQKVCLKVLHLNKPSDLPRLRSYWFS